mgnify:CR=1 FL=1
MQAIARVNRVFRDKLGGLVVDYLGLADRRHGSCLLYTSDAADERYSVDLGGRRIVKKKKNVDHGGCRIISQKTR